MTCCSREGSVLHARDAVSDVLIRTRPFPTRRCRIWVCRSRLCISYAWKVVFLDLSAPQREPFMPPPPSKEFPSLRSSRRTSAYKFKRIQVASMSASSAPRNLPWSTPSDPSASQQAPGILDQPYKKAFGDGVNERMGGRGRGGGGMGGRGGRGGRDAPPKSVAWRKKTSATRIRHSSGAGSASGPQRKLSGRAKYAASPSDSGRAPAYEEGKVQPSPFRPAPRPDTRSSMCLRSPAAGRSQCRLLL